MVLRIVARLVVNQPEQGVGNQPRRRQGYADVPPDHPVGQVGLRQAATYPLRPGGDTDQDDPAPHGEAANFRQLVSRAAAWRLERPSLLAWSGEGSEDHREEQEMD